MSRGTQDGICARRWRQSFVTWTQQRLRSICSPWEPQRAASPASSTLHTGSWDSSPTLPLVHSPAYLSSEGLLHPWSCQVKIGKDLRSRQRLNMLQRPACCDNQADCSILIWLSGCRESFIIGSSSAEIAFCYYVCMQLLPCQPVQPGAGECCV